MDETLFNRIAKALGDPTRFEILEIIARSDEISCGMIKKQLSVAQPTISHHLKELANADLVLDRREGQFIYYHLRRDVFEHYLRRLRERIG